jgi:hypothetical protein
MKERRRLLRLEAKMSHEVKRKEAQYWHVKTLKVLSEMPGDPVIEVTPGPLLDSQLIQQIEPPAHKEVDERNVNICLHFVCLSTIYQGTVGHDFLQVTKAKTKIFISANPDLFEKMF